MFKILSFELSWKHGDYEPWFAIPASAIGKKGTYNYLKNRFDKHDFTWEGEDEEFVFDRSIYRALKDFVDSNDYVFDSDNIEGPSGGEGTLFPTNFRITVIKVLDI